MRKLDTSEITTSTGFPVKSGTLVHIQAAYAEAFSSICQAIVGSADYDPTKAYVLTGCVNTGSGSTYDISAGAVFFAGEVYQVPAASFTVSGGNVAAAAIVVSFFADATADPVTLTNGSPYNAHQIRQIVVAPGLAGSGIDADFSTWLPLFLNIQPVNLTAGTNVTITGTYPNKTINAPFTVPFRVLSAGNTEVGDVAPSVGTDVDVIFPLDIGTASYRVSCQIISESGNASVDTRTTCSVRAKTSAGFTAHFEEYGSGTQDISIDWVVFATS